MEICGGGWPVAGVIVKVRGNRPSVVAVYDPLKVAFEEGLPAGGDVVLNELTSTVPLITEVPSEMNWPVNP